MFKANLRQKFKTKIKSGVYVLFIIFIYFLFGLDGGFQVFRHSADLFEEIRRSSHGASVPEILLPLKRVNFII